MDKLPVIETWRLTARALALRRWPLLRALLGMSVVGVVLFWVAAMNLSLLGLWSGVVFFLLHYLLLALMAVIVHRVILLGPDSLPNGWGTFFTLREILYFGALLLLFWPLFHIFLIAGIYPTVQGGVEERFEVLDVIVRALCILAPWYLAGRVSLVFPAISIERTEGPLCSWRRTRGNGWRVVLVLAAPLVALPVLLWFIIDWIFSVADQSLLELLNLLQVFVWIGFLLLLVVWTVAVLSIVYRKLEGGDPVGDRRDRQVSGRGGMALGVDLEDRPEETANPT